MSNEKTSKEGDSTETKNESKELILNLQNRINTLEAKLDEAEKERKSFSGVDRKMLDETIAMLRGELAQTRKDLTEVKEEKKEQSRAKSNETSGEGEGSVNSGLKSLSVFDE